MLFKKIPIVKTGLTISLFVILNFGFVNTVFSATSNLDNAVDQAGKQRMITQRLLKDYAMVGMSLEYGNPREDLKKMILQFNQTLDDLKTLSVNDEIDQSLQEIESLWQPIKVTLETDPEQAKVSSLQRDLEVLLDVCHQNTGLISKASGSESGEIINLAGRQRMLSQRLASLYMLKVWGLDDPEFNDKLHKTMDEFSAAQETLEASSLTTPEIKKKLTQVKKSFFWFEMMGKSKSGKYTPSLISKSSDNMLVEMNEVTTLYATSK